MKLGLIGRADHDNYGDSLMFAFYVDALIRSGLDVDVYIVGASDVFMKRLHDCGLKCGSISVAEIKILDKAYFIGGGYFGEPDINAEKWSDGFVKEGFFSSVYDALVDGEVEYSICGAEVGPISDARVSGIVGNIVGNAKWVVVRNIESVDFIKERYGISAKFQRDIVLGETLNFYKRRANLTNDRPNSLVVHGTGKFFKSNPISFLYRMYLKIHILYHGYDAVTVLFDQSTYPDLNVKAERFCKALYRAGKVSVASYSGIMPLLNVLAGSKKVITTKLHVGVSAVSLGGEVFCISGMEKNKRFYNEVFQGGGRVGLVNAFLNPFLLVFPKFVSREGVKDKEIESSLVNVELVVSDAMKC